MITIQLEEEKIKKSEVIIGVCICKTDVIRINVLFCLKICIFNDEYRIENAPEVENYVQKRKRERFSNACDFSKVKHPHAILQYFVASTMRSE